MATKLLTATPLTVQELERLIELCNVAHDHLLSLKHATVMGTAQSPGASALYASWSRHATHLILRLRLILKDIS